MNNDSPTVRKMAVSLTFHQGLPSVMSYAALSVVMIETTAPELLHSVSRNAIVRIPPRELFEICRI